MSRFRTIWEVMRAARQVDLKAGDVREGWRSDNEIAAAARMSVSETRTYLAQIAKAPTVQHRAPDLWRFVEPKVKRPGGFFSWLHWLAKGGR